MNTPIGFVIHPGTVKLQPTDEGGSALPIPLVHPPVACVLIPIAASVCACPMPQILEYIALHACPSHRVDFRYIGAWDTKTMQGQLLLFNRFSPIASQELRSHDSDSEVELS